MTTMWSQIAGARFVRACLLILLAAASGRAGVLKVDPNGGAGVFTDIQPAVNAAQGGDTILVKGQEEYSTFVIDGKGLQLVVDPGSYADISFEFGPGITIRNLPAGNPVVLRGFRSRPTPFPLGAPVGEGIKVDNCAADVWLEDGTFTGSDGSNLFPVHKAGWSGTRVTGCHSVAFVRCLLGGGDGFSQFTFFGSESAGNGAHGMEATSSSVYVYDSTPSGGNGGTVSGFAGSTFPGGNAGHGALLDGALLFASGSSFTGGAGGSGGYNSASGVCGAGGDGGSGLRLAANAPSAVRLDSSSAGGVGGIGGGGQGGPSGCGPDGAPGQDVTIDPGGVSSVLPGTSRHLVQSAVTREQSSLVLTLHGVSGDKVFLLVGVIQGSKFIPSLKGALLPSLTPPLTIGLGIMPPAGVLEFTFTIPELGPGLDAIWAYNQAVVSNTTDGWVLTSPSASLLLDKSL